jgi:hypothetical protein
MPARHQMTAQPVLELAPANREGAKYAEDQPSSEELPQSDMQFHIRPPVSKCEPERKHHAASRI